MLQKENLSLFINTLPWVCKPEQDRKKLEKRERERKKASEKGSKEKPLRRTLL